MGDQGKPWAMTGTPEDDIVHRQLDTSHEEPAVAVAEAVADIDGVESSDLPTMYECVDGVLDHLFSTPPDPEAQMDVTFSFHSYRITVEQTGDAKFVKTE